MIPYYEQDGITIYHGDCREVLPLLAFDAIVTDPNYGIGANRMTLGNGSRRVYRGERDWDNEPADLAPLLASGVPAIVWGGNYFGLPPSSRWLVWDKGTGDNDYADCELAWTNLQGVVKKYFRSWVGRNAKEYGEADRYHPTQKPLELMRWCLGFVEGLVLDPFMGSGTTLRAAKDLGRKAIGIEIEERYCEIAARRLQQSVLPLEMATTTFDGQTTSQTIKLQEFVQDGDAYDEGDVRTFERAGVFANADLGDTFGLSELAQ